MKKWIVSVGSQTFGHYTEQFNTLDEVREYGNAKAAELKVGHRANDPVEVKVYRNGTSEMKSFVL